MFGLQWIAAFGPTNLLGAGSLVNKFEQDLFRRAMGEVRDDPLLCKLVVLPEGLHSLGDFHFPDDLVDECSTFFAPGFAFLSGGWQCGCAAVGHRVRNPGA